MGEVNSDFEGQYVGRTLDDAMLTAAKRGGFAIIPSFGVSDLRNVTSTTGTGAAITYTSGELKLSSGTDGSGEAQIDTRERGRYEPGTSAEAGLGVRIPTQPSGSQEIRWGYFDDDNGFGWGYDATGLFVFVRREGSDAHKTYQSSWNQDKLDGTGKSRVDIDPANGLIFKTIFRHYGYGPVQWAIERKDFIRPFEDQEANQQLAHVWDPSSSVTGVSVIQPNQPIRVEVANGGTASNLDVFVGGRQFTPINGTSRLNQRSVNALIEDYTLTVSAGTWEPIIAIRPKPTFPPGSGLTNAVNVRFQAVATKAASSVSQRTTVLNTMGTTTWADPDNWSSGDVAVEVAKADGTLAVSSAGQRVPPFTFIAANAPARTAVQREESVFVLNQSANLVCWLKADSGTPEVSMEVEWTEGW